MLSQLQIDEDAIAGFGGDAGFGGGGWVDGRKLERFDERADDEADL